MTMVPVTSKATFKAGKCTIRGDIITRWSNIGGRVPDLIVQITDSPLGEIHITSDTPPVFMLHTNVFITQFTAQWGN